MATESKDGSGRLKPFLTFELNSAAIQAPLHMTSKRVFFIEDENFEPWTTAEIAAFYLGIPPPPPNIFLGQGTIMFLFQGSHTVKMDSENQTIPKSILMLV